MTQEQKRLLRMVPVAVLILGGLLAAAFLRTQKGVEHLSQQGPPTTPVPLPSPQPLQTDIDRTSAAVELLVLGDVERQLDKDEGFVRKVEAEYPAVRDEGVAEAKSKLDEQVGKAAKAIGERRRFLDEVRVDRLPEGERARVAAARTRCADLLDRLVRCRPAD